MEETNIDPNQSVNDGSSIPAEENNEEVVAEEEVANTIVDGADNTVAPTEAGDTAATVAPVEGGDANTEEDTSEDAETPATEEQVTE